MTSTREPTGAMQYPGPSSQDWLGPGGQRELVAGAGGIGSACATAFAAAGARMAAVDISADRLPALDHGITGVTADLTTLEGCNTAVENTASRWGGQAAFITGQVLYVDGGRTLV